MRYSIDMQGSGDLPIEDVRRIVATSFESWTNTLCDGTQIALEVEEGPLADCRRPQHRRSGANVNVIAFLEEWPGRFDDTAFAITSVWHSRRTGEIWDADIVVNEEHFPWTECPSRGACPEGPDGLPLVDLQNVMTHEIGHFFGMAHSEFVATTMDARSPRGEIFKRILRTDDVEGICTIYPPASAPAECDFTPRGGEELFCSESAGCSAAGDAESPWLFLLAVVFLRRRR